MKRYYFFKGTDLVTRSNHRKFGAISIRLVALYAEDVFHNRTGKKQKSFKFFDDLESIIISKKDNPRYGHCDFSLDTGTDSSAGHWAKSTKELLDEYRRDGYKQVTEKQYARLRELAIKLLFQHSNFVANIAGDNKFLWHNNSSQRWNEVRLLGLNFLDNRRNYDSDFLKYLNEKGLPTDDVRVSDDIHIFMSKDSEDQKRFKSYKFHIRSLGEHAPAYNSFNDAESRFFRRNDGEGEELTELQYKRVRRLCKAFMKKYCVLDIEDIKKRQDYTVTVLF